MSCWEKFYRLSSTIHKLIIIRSEDYLEIDFHILNFSSVLWVFFSLFLFDAELTSQYESLKNCSTLLTRKFDKILKVETFFKKITETNNECVVEKSLKCLHTAETMSQCSVEQCVRMAAPWLFFCFLKTFGWIGFFFWKNCKI